MTEHNNQAQTVIAGREREKSAIRAAIDAAADGRGQVLFILGEPGIGKSTLAEYAVQRAGKLAAFRGFSWETGGAPAYWPWTQLLRSLITSFELEVHSVSGIGRILPELESADASDMPDLNPDQANFMLFEAVRQLLQDLTRDTPLLLLLEDLHAADSDSLQLLQYLARHVKAMPLLLIGTFREAEARANPGGKTLWQSARDATTLRLTSLDDKAARQVLATRELPDNVVDRLIDVSGGNPLFLTELGAVAGSDDLGSLPLPQSVQQLISRQLEHLPDETLRLLETASVVGRQFTIADLLADDGMDGATAPAVLSAAKELAVVKTSNGQRWWFNHSLVREVLYEGIDDLRRQGLHRARAEQVQTLIRNGEQDRWAELAAHLAAAGYDHLLRAVDAWRQAARIAAGKYAFKEAHRLLEQAYREFGDGPTFTAEHRCELMLELASARLTLGMAEAGQGLCVDAFQIAKSLNNSELMARAALTYGNIIVVAKVDRVMIDLLKEALSALPEHETGQRAKVLARLAAAMQPAPNPAEPMAMAREAIAMARTTEDEDVIYEVLGYGMSALMDFADVDERVPLNKEYAELATGRRDLPKQFRSYLRLMIDYSEAGDRTLMDAAIRECELCADRVNLPHYRWRVASAHAMQASIEGRFDDALVLLKKAEQLAGEASDHTALITIPLQRYALLYEWNAPAAPDLEKIEQTLSSSLAAFPDADVYARPLFASFSLRTGSPIPETSKLTDEVVERIFAGGDRFCVSRVGEIAVAIDDERLARRAYDKLNTHREYCSAMGLMGSYWAGPVALSMAGLAHYLGELEDAESLYRTAVEITERMRARPYLARTYDGIARLAEHQGDVGRANRHAAMATQIAEQLSLRALHSTGEQRETRPADPVDKAFDLQLEGDVWRVRYGDSSALVKNTKGVQMLARLLAEPDTEFHVLDLSNASQVEQGDAGPMLDEQARATYQSRVTELKDELEEAESMGDIGRAEAARDELDFISAELSRAFGLGGRKRTTGSSAERARVNVRRRIIDAIKRIDEQIPGAGRYLENSIKTGTYCRYTPV